VIIVEQPAAFFAVGQWYEDFSQLTDDEVRAALGVAA
jgi:predicted phosphoribosyltransferase